MIASIRWIAAQPIVALFYCSAMCMVSAAIVANTIAGYDLILLRLKDGNTGNTFTEGKPEDWG